MWLRTRAGLVPVIALALSLVGGLPAHAERYRHVDARHDVVDLDTGTRAPHYRKADITRVRLNHGARNVTIALRLRSTSYVHVDMRTLGFAIKTPGHHRYSGSWIQGRGFAQYDLWDDTEGHRVRCRETSDIFGRTVWIRLARDCFDDPDWVRVAAGVSTDRDEGHQFQAWGDNALAGADSATYDVYSPRLRTTA